MRRSSLKPLLAACLWSLFPSAAGADGTETPDRPGVETSGPVSFEPGVEAEAAARWEALVRGSWTSWETRFGAAVSRPAIRVGLGDVATMPRTLGRTRGGRIELNRLLPREGADDVVRHETAHVFVQAACPAVAAGTPLLSEAFALFATGDAARRVFQAAASPGGTPVSAAEARRWLLTRGTEAQGHEPAAQKALAVMLSQPGRRDAWEAWFRGLVAACGRTSFSASAEQIAFLDLVRSDPAPPAPARIDFVLVDGHSHDELASEGKPDDRSPPGSILKPLLVATVPELMEERLSRATPAWACPDVPRKREVWKWQSALARSCNGFFLDFEPSSPEAFGEWNETLERFGFPDPPRTMAGRIGLDPNFTLSPREAVRLYSWIARRAPFVIEALTKTPIDGTLASAPDAAWFAERRIALKTGTLRDATSRPLHGWIVAVGELGETGTPAFLAAIHATAVAPAVLLPELKGRLEAEGVVQNESARVQILGLAPFTTIGLWCEPGVPLFVRDAAGVWSLRGVGGRVRSGSLEPNSTYACGARPLLVEFVDSKGRQRARRYAGTLTVGPPSPRAGPELASSAPLREKSARARLGSRFVLTTSERSYLISSLLSEFPSGHIEVLKALALVMRHQLGAGRHGEDPPCDTTHCHLFGQEEGVTPADRRAAREAVAAVREVELVEAGDGATSRAERRWLAFYLDDRVGWKTTRSAATVREALGLDAEPTEVRRSTAGSIAVVAGAEQRVPCELFRNQLRLPSCPTGIARVSRDFVIEGHGEGHGAGLVLTEANVAAQGGSKHPAILARFFPEVRIAPRHGAAKPRPFRPPGAPNGVSPPEKAWDSLSRSCFRGALSEASLSQASAR